MKSIAVILIFLSCFIFKSVAQELVEVTDQTLKIPSHEKEELYFGFAEGDKVIFNFHEVDKKKLKEMEIVEYPDNSKFSDFKTNKVENKIFNVTRKSVYIFRFKNEAISGCICKIKIQRIPASTSTRNFNTGVKWVEKPDTSWNSYTKDIIVGYDTLYEQKTKRELIKTEHKVDVILDKRGEKVHTANTQYGNKVFVSIPLPENQSTFNTTTRIIGWAYWMGVGDDAALAWKRNEEAISNLAKGAATLISGNPLVGLITGAVVDLAIPKSGDAVIYKLTDEYNKNLFQRGIACSAMDDGEGKGSFKKITSPSQCQGTYYLCLQNNNMFMAINVTIKAVAVIETNTYEDKVYTDVNIRPRYEKKILSEPVITMKRAPITGP